MKNKGISNDTILGGYVFFCNFASLYIIDNYAETVL